MYLCGMDEPMFHRARVVFGEAGERETKSKSTMFSHIIIIAEVADKQSAKINEKLTSQTHIHLHRVFVCVQKSTMREFA